MYSWVKTTLKSCVTLVCDHISAEQVCVGELVGVGETVGVGEPVCVGEQVRLVKQVAVGISAWWRVTAVLHLGRKASRSERQQRHHLRFCFAVSAGRGAACVTDD